MHELLNRYRRVVVAAAVAMALPMSACDPSEPEQNNGPGTSNNGSECIAGEAGCACAAGACSDGLECTMDVCVEPGTSSAGLTIGNPDARSCELLFEQGASELVSATYGAETTGALRHRAPRVALALTRTSDTAFAADSVSLGLRGEVSGLTLSSSRCFGADGGVVDGQITLK